MISTPDRQNAITLIDQANAAGACRARACAELGIDERTCRRWRAMDGTPADRRLTALRPAPRNMLSEEERQAVLDTCNSKAFESLPPSQIVPRLADQGRYIASEASFYRIPRAEGQQHHRGRAKPSARRQPPTSHGTGKNLGRYAASRMGCWPNPSRRSSTAALTCSTRWAPLGVQRIC
jgi:putative transposase